MPNQENDGKKLTIPSNVVAPILTMENNLTVNDLLAVAVGKVEDSLRSKLRDSEKAIKVIEKSLKNINKALNDAASNMLTSSGLAAELEKIKVPLKKLFPRESFKTLFNPSIQINREGKVVTFSYYIGYNQRATRDVDFDAEIIDLFEQRDQDRDNLELEQENQNAIRMKLSNIPVLERRYKGILAESQLQKSDQGKELLETLTLNIEDECDRL